MAHTSPEGPGGGKNLPVVEYDDNIDASNNGDYRKAGDEALHALKNDLGPAIDKVKMVIGFGIVKSRKAKAGAKKGVDWFKESAERTAGSIHDTYKGVRSSLELLATDARKRKDERQERRRAAREKSKTEYDETASAIGERYDDAIGKIRQDRADRKGRAEQRRTDAENGQGDLMELLGLHDRALDLKKKASHARKELQDISGEITQLLEKADKAENAWRLARQVLEGALRNRPDAKDELFELQYELKQADLARMYWANKANLADEKRGRLEAEIASLEARVKRINEHLDKQRGLGSYVMAAMNRLAGSVTDKLRAGGEALDYTRAVTERTKRTASNLAKRALRTALGR